MFSCKSCEIFKSISGGLLLNVVLKHTRIIIWFCSAAFNVILFMVTQFKDTLISEAAFTLIYIQWNLYEADTIGATKCVRFIEIFSKAVWPQSKAIRSSSYCLSYWGVRFIVCPLYRDSTVLMIYILICILLYTLIYKHLRFCINLCIKKGIRKTPPR